MGQRCQTYTLDKVNCRFDTLSLHLQFEFTMQQTVLLKLLLGNAKDLTIREILAAANNNRYVKMLAKGNLPALMRNIPEKQLKDIAVDNFHKACWKLITMHQENAACSRLEN